jgi:hypothetical protein
MDLKDIGEPECYYFRCLITPDVEMAKLSTEKYLGRHDRFVASAPTACAHMRDVGI